MQDGGGKHLEYCILTYDQALAVSLRASKGCRRNVIEWLNEYKRSIMTLAQYGMVVHNKWLNPTQITNKGYYAFMRWAASKGLVVWKDGHYEAAKEYENIVVKTCKFKGETFVRFNIDELWKLAKRGA